MELQTTSIVATNIDDLVVRGMRNIQLHGERFAAEFEGGLQAYFVDYVLTNPLNRVHILRSPKSIKYMCREFIAYFNGSLNVNDGLIQASKFWVKVADKHGNISSNYGYYVFYQKVPTYGNKTQLEWVLDCLANNLDTRKAFINISQPHHKTLDMRDFPCTAGLQFFVRQNHLCCNVFSRSTDVFTGLPYDMAFFAFLTEFVYVSLKHRLPLEVSKTLKLGHTTMKTNFTQIYDKTKDQVIDLLKNLPSEYFIISHENEKKLQMPEIDEPKKLLDDIYHRTQNTTVSQWLYKHAEF